MGMMRYTELVAVDKDGKQVEVVRADMSSGSDVSGSDGSRRPAPDRYFLHDLNGPELHWNDEGALVDRHSKETYSVQ